MSCSSLFEFVIMSEGLFPLTVSDFSISSSGSDDDDSGDGGDVDGGGVQLIKAPKSVKKEYFEVFCTLYYF